MLKRLAFRLAAAVAAAAYWWMIAWACFAASGSDPVDVLSGTAPLASMLVVAGIVAAAVVGYALADRLVVRRGRGIRG